MPLAAVSLVHISLIRNYYDCTKLKLLIAAMDCPRGMIYNFNGLAVPPSCVRPFGDDRLPNAEVCECPAGQVLLDLSTCVKPTECPCIDEDGVSHDVSQL